MPQGAGWGDAIGEARNPYCKVCPLSRTLQTKEGHLF